MTAERVHGRDYRALRRLVDLENHTLADVGDTCEKVPTDVLPLLLASGKIERAEERRVSSLNVVPNRRKARR